ASPSGPLAYGTFTPQVLLFGGGNEISVQPFFSGLAPALAGVYQVNFIVPDNTPRGEVLLALQAPGFARSETVGVTIQ
ncbi:MAG: hypothetical protein KDC27_10255, partial [Acidobacteria bacterium]|nr:hypothetical protein [Acidobacteriota bacterium]